MLCDSVAAVTGCCKAYAKPNGLSKQNWRPCVCVCAKWCMNVFAYELNSLLCSADRFIVAAAAIVDVIFSIAASAIAAHH